jgi:hypothetical protein
MGMLRRWWRWLGAATRFSPDAVCELSRGLPEDDDFHDWPDSAVRAPWHFYVHTCRRCGKRFTI